MSERERAQKFVVYCSCTLIRSGCAPCRGATAGQDRANEPEYDSKSDSDYHVPGDSTPAAGVNTAAWPRAAGRRF